MENREEMIDEILRHLDSETQLGVKRMSVNFDARSDVEKEVSHKGCMAYGRTAQETVGLLDMYTDMNAGEPDNVRRYGLETKNVKR